MWGPLPKVVKKLNVTNFVGQRKIEKCDKISGTEEVLVLNEM